MDYFSYLEPRFLSSDPLSHLASVQVCQERMKTQFLNKKLEANSAQSATNARTNGGIITQTASPPRRGIQ